PRSRRRGPGRQPALPPGAQSLTWLVVEPKTLDHVAFWVTQRPSIVANLQRHLGMHVITEEANFTLTRSHARHGKLTLFHADGPRAPGALDYGALRVSTLAAARAELAPGTPEFFDVGDGIRVTLVEAPTEVEYDLDHVSLLTGDPSATAEAYERYGFDAAGPA